MSNPPRRRNPRPPAGDSLCVPSPKVADVWDTREERFIPASSVIGSDYVSLMRLRMQVRDHYLRGDPLFKCGLCGAAVYICCARDEKRFFFKHRHEDGNCPSATAGALSHDEILARQYNGAKEGETHKRMKDWLVRALSADPGFSNIRQEATWKGAWTSEWRRPDVVAQYQGVRIAFEIQLATTFLEVIVARRSFYLQEGGLLFWVFARLDTDRLRMTEEDVFYNNNNNAFVINEQTVAQSIRDGAFQLECTWVSPQPDGGMSGLQKKIVRFDEVTLDLSGQRGYYFDFDGALAQLQERKELQRQQLRDLFHDMSHRTNLFFSKDSDDWRHLKRSFAWAGIPFVDEASQLAGSTRKLLQLLYSAKLGTAFASRHPRLISIAHYAAEHRQHLCWFLHAIDVYKRGDLLTEQDRTGLWKKKMMLLQAMPRPLPAAYEPERKCQALIEFLFPELVPLPESFPNEAWSDQASAMPSVDLTLPISCAVTAYWCRHRGHRLEQDAIRATGRDCWLWMGRDPFRGQTLLARIAADERTAASHAGQCIEILDHAEIADQRDHGILISGRTLDLSHTLSLQERHQSVWCVYRR